MMLLQGEKTDFNFEKFFFALDEKEKERANKLYLKKNTGWI